MDPAPRPNAWNAGRIVALVFGVLLLLLSCLLLAGGGGLLSADLTERTDDGYLFSPQQTITAPGYALVSERIDLGEGADWLPVAAALGTARVDVTGTESGSETFVGIAPVADVTAYLGEVERTVIDDFGIGLSAGSQPTVVGGEPAGPPVDQDFWTASTAGAGTQQLSWVPAEGDWMLVIMNADGSAGISVQARVGATVPALDGLGWGLLVAGLVCLAIAVLLLVLAIRRPSDRRGAAPSVAGPVPAGHRAAASGPPSSGPLPPWVPPTQSDRSTAPDAQPSPERTPKQP